MENTVERLEYTVQYFNHGLHLPTLFDDSFLWIFQVSVLYNCASCSHIRKCTLNLLKIMAKEKSF